MKPIIFFDLETTGVDLESDRIVQFSAIKVNAEFETIGEPKDVLINPEISISEEATAVHGITNEMVQGKPTFKQFALGIKTFFEGCDLAGYNILEFDVPLLAEEFARLGIKWPEPGTLYLDALRIFREKEKRDLAGAVKFYTGREIEAAHNALGDNISTISVLTAQMKRYEDLGAMTREQLSEYCIGDRKLDLAGKIGLNEAGEPIYAFGKDKGKTIKENPGFGLWMLKNKFTTNTKDVLREIMGYKSSIKLK